MSEKTKGAIWFLVRNGTIGALILTPFVLTDPPKSWGDYLLWLFAWLPTSFMVAATVGHIKLRRAGVYDDPRESLDAHSREGER